MAWEIDHYYGFGSIVKKNNPNNWDNPKHAVEDISFGTFGDQCNNLGDYGNYVIIKDTCINLSKDNFGNYPLLIKIHVTESYKMALWRDKIIKFSTLNDMTFEEPSWMIATFSS